MVANPATLVITQYADPKTIIMTNPASPAKCGSYSYSISPPNSFVFQNGPKITVSPTLLTQAQVYVITTTSTMDSEPQLFSQTTITVTVIANNPPVFKPVVSEIIAIYMTTFPLVWQLKLPSIVDDDVNDKVTIALDK